MKQQPFEQKYTEEWQAFADMLAKKPVAADFPERYRRICQHMAIARSRHYSASLCAQLNQLVMRGHEVLYGTREPLRFALWRYLLQTLPATLGANRVYVLIALALFFVPLLLAALTTYFNEEFILSLMSAEMVAEYEAMYDPLGEHQQQARLADDDWLMFGFYIQNNIGIAFQTFASGIFACAGSIFFLFFNGLMIGATAGHLTHMGFADTFYPFIAGHGSFELTAIALAGAAGLRLGYALVDPKQLSRLQALRFAGADAVKIIYIVTLMLLVAALIEAFWSSSRTVPAAVKYAVGLGFWALVLYYLVFCLMQPQSAYEPK